MSKPGLIYATEAISAHTHGPFKPGEFARWLEQDADPNTAYLVQVGEASIVLGSGPTDEGSCPHCGNEHPNAGPGCEVCEDAKEVNCSYCYQAGSIAPECPCCTGTGLEPCPECCNPELEEADAQFQAGVEEAFHNYEVRRGLAIGEIRHVTP